MQNLLYIIHMITNHLICILRHWAIFKFMYTTQWPLSALLNLILHHPDVGNYLPPAIRVDKITCVAAFVQYKLCLHSTTRVYSIVTLDFVDLIFTGSLQ